MESRRPRPIAWLLLLAALVLTTPGCAQRETRSPDRVAAADSMRADTGYVDPAEVPHPCPPQPTGPQVGRGDPLLEAAAPRLAEWEAMWAAAMPGFAADSTWFVARGRWAPVYTRPFERVPESDDDVTFAVLGLRSPDGWRVLDIDAYQYIRPEGDGLEVGGEPDSQAGLIDQGTQIEAVLQQCGTPCGFHWGTWLSATSFALAGWREADDFGQWVQGRLWIYSITDSTVAEYQTRIVSAADYERYDAAWHAWLLKRYRAIKQARPPA